MNKHYLAAIATLLGTIIGAGVLGIPYVVAQAGFFVGALNIVVLGFVALMVYLYFGEVVLRTPGNHQLSGYAEIYLGKWAKYIIMFSMMFGIYSALIAYVIGEGYTLTSLLGGNPMYWMIAYLFVISIFVYFGIKAVEKSEMVLGVCMLAVVAIIIGLLIPHISASNLNHFNISRFFLPYGVVLFAFLGMSAVPELKEELINNRKLMKSAIIIGVLIPLFIYFLFALTVVGSIGLENFNALAPDERIASIALDIFFPGSGFALFGNLFAFFSMSTSFIALGMALKQMYVYDFKIKNSTAWALVCFVPLAIALSGMTHFIEAISLSGIVSGGIDIIIILLMAGVAKKMGKRKPEYSIPINIPVSIVIIILFFVGIVWHLKDFF